MRVTFGRLSSIAGIIYLGAFFLPSAGAQTRALDGASLFVEFSDHTGKEILLTGGRVFGANNDGALVRAAGATFRLSADGMDRETHRYFLRHCSGIIAGQDCAFPLIVTPTGDRGPFNQPVLRAAKIAR